MQKIIDYLSINSELLVFKETIINEKGKTLLI